MIVLFFILTYLLSAIPFGLLLSKCFGEDIREYGSRNIGATNITRRYGLKYGVLVFLLDAAKGMIPVLIAKFIIEDVQIVYICAFCAVMGHMFPVYLSFKGGKGVATFFGILLILNYILFFCAVIVWGAIYMVCKVSFISSLASVCAVSIVSIILLPADLYMMILGMNLFIIYRHRTNIIGYIKNK